GSVALSGAGKNNPVVSCDGRVLELTFFKRVKQAKGFISLALQKERIGISREDKWVLRAFRIGLASQLVTMLAPRVGKQRYQREVVLEFGSQGDEGRYSRQQIVQRCGIALLDQPVVKSEESPFFNREVFDNGPKGFIQLGPPIPGRRSADQ